MPIFNLSEERKASAWFSMLLAFKSALWKQLPAKAETRQSGYGAGWRYCCEFPDSLHKLAWEGSFPFFPLDLLQASHCVSDN